MRAFVILRSPTRQSRYGDGAAEGPKNLLGPSAGGVGADPSLPPSLKFRRTGRAELALSWKAQLDQKSRSFAALRMTEKEAKG